VEHGKNKKSIRKICYVDKKRVTELNIQKCFKKPAVAFKFFKIYFNQLFKKLKLREFY